MRHEFGTASRPHRVGPYSRISRVCRSQNTRLEIFPNREKAEGGLTAEDMKHLLLRAKPWRRWRSSVDIQVLSRITCAQHRQTTRPTISRRHRRGRPSDQLV